MNVKINIEYTPNGTSPTEIKGYCEIPPHIGRFNIITFSKAGDDWVISSQMAIPNDFRQAAIALHCMNETQKAVARHQPQPEPLMFEDEYLEASHSDDAMATIERNAGKVSISPNPKTQTEKEQQIYGNWGKNEFSFLPLNQTRVMSNQKLLFGDIETGGFCHRLDDGTLGAESLPIFELALILTDAELNEIGEPLRLVIHHSDSDIAKSDPWAIDTHTKSGLIDEVKRSVLSMAEAEEQILNWLITHGIEPFSGRGSKGLWLAGSSIFFDRCYIMAQMPKLHAFMHYRQLDVSALALAARLWAPEVEKDAIDAKEYRHEALADIRETIEELRLYRNRIFTPDILP